MTIGEVFLGIAVFFATVATLWSTLMACALLFPARAQRAQRTLTVKPVNTIVTGLIGGGLATLIGILLISTKNGLFMMLGWGFLLVLFALASLGSAGLALLVSERIRTATNDNLTHFAAVGRAAGLLVAAGLTPVLGWFLLAPLTIAASLGAGVVALFGKDPIAAATTSPSVMLVTEPTISIEAAE